MNVFNIHHYDPTALSSWGLNLDGVAPCGCGRLLHTCFMVSHGHILSRPAENEAISSWYKVDKSYAWLNGDDSLSCGSLLSCLFTQLK